MLLLEECQKRSRHRTDGTHIDSCAGASSIECSRDFETAAIGRYGMFPASFMDDTLTLQGIVPSFYLKQTAQVIAAKASGAYQVNNQIVVSDSEFDRTKPTVTDPEVAMNVTAVGCVIPTSHCWMYIKDFFWDQGFEVEVATMSRNA